MEEKNNSEQKVILYTPGSSEKKRAVLMYFFLGIVLVSVRKGLMNAFEYVHFKQAVGWRSVFFLVLVTNIVLLFVPVLKILSILILIVVCGILAFFVKQAREGKYYQQKQDSFLFVFQGLGARIIDLFDLQLYEKKITNDVVDEKIEIGGEQIGDISLDIKEEKNV